MLLCAVCGQEVGGRFGRDPINNLVYCALHTQLGGSPALECQNCEQRVAQYHYTDDVCPKCGINFNVAAQERHEAMRGPVIERLKKVGPKQFLVFNILSCLVTGTVFFLIIHWLGKLITPIGAAAILAAVILVSQRFALRGHGYESVALIGRTLDMIAIIGHERIIRFVVGKELGSEKMKRALELFSLASNFEDVSTTMRLIMLIASTLLVELFWPGFFHNLVVAAIVGIASSVIDTILFRTKEFPLALHHLDRINYLEWRKSAL
jgi:hypothetical protein